MKKISKTFLFLGILLSGYACIAAMTSETYSIKSDVIGSAGGLGTSETYNLRDTLGEPVIGVGQSETFSAQQGFWYTLNYSLTMMIDSHTVNLGTVVSGTPRTGNSIITVTTDSWGGYDIYASEDHAMLHSDSSTTLQNYACSISSPCAWSGVGLGFSVTSGTGVDAKWGSNPNYNYAGFPLAPTIIHAKTGYTSGGDNTNIQYKVDAPPTQKAGAYSNVITYTATAKL
jgi:hypothetical protein